MCKQVSTESREISGLVGMVLLLAAGTGAAQPAGSILLFSDPGYTDCTLIDADASLHTVYVVHNTGTGATAVLFALLNLGASGLTYVGEAVAPFVHVGNTQVELGVTYGECRTGLVLVCTVVYAGDGTSGSCSSLNVIGSLIVGMQAEAVDCSFGSIFPAEGRLIVNPDETCPCTLPVAVEETTWGRVKALYQ